jgi:toxin ParE1/3/4
LRRSVVWSDEARQDIRGFATYITDHNIAAARKVSAIIRKTGNDLGKLATGHHGRIEDTYEVGVSHLPYIIAYAIERDSQDIESIVILRIIHTARNWTENKWPT